MIHREYNLADLQAIAYRDDRKKRVIAVFRGSSSIKDWIQNTKTWTSRVANVNVHSGVYEQLVYNRSMTNMRQVIRPLIRSGYDVYLTGHSLGGQLATLFGVLLAIDVPNRVTVVSFGSPKVGDATFCERAAKLSNLRHWRVWKGRDLAVSFPLGKGYVHQGTPLWLDRKNKLQTTVPRIRCFNPFDHPIQRYLAAW